MRKVLRSYKQDSYDLRQGLCPAVVSRLSAEIMLMIEYGICSYSEIRITFFSILITKLSLLYVFIVDKKMT